MTKSRALLLLATSLCLPVTGLPSPYAVPTAAAQEPIASNPTAPGPPVADEVPAPLTEDELEILVARIALIRTSWSLLLPLLRNTRCRSSRQRGSSTQSRSSPVSSRRRRGTVAWSRF